MGQTKARNYQRYTLAYKLIAVKLANHPDVMSKMIAEALDLAFFEAFNTCNLEVWKKYLAEDIEFYQDNDDVTTSRAELVPSFLDRCGKDNVARLQRELVTESVEVHPIQGLGAVQFGIHHFWTMKNKERNQLPFVLYIVWLKSILGFGCFTCVSGDVLHNSWGTICFWCLCRRSN